METTGICDHSHLASHTWVSLLKLLKVFLEMWFESNICRTLETNKVDLLCVGIRFRTIVVPGETFLARLAWEGLPVLIRWTSAPFRAFYFPGAQQFVCSELSWMDTEQVPCGCGTSSPWWGMITKVSGVSCHLPENPHGSHWGGWCTPHLDCSSLQQGFWCPQPSADFLRVPVCVLWV